MNSKNLSFEVGPIRPPSEARSLLLRLTRNCPWNQCRFCPVYKGRKFSLRSIEDIEQDIQTAKDIADDITALSWQLGQSGAANDAVLSHIMTSGKFSPSYRQVAVWLYYGTRAVFLQDADNLIMKTDDLVDVLEFLTERFTNLSRVTTYSRSRTVVRKSLDSLKRIRKAGLNRIHIGLETGYDPLLKLMKKGVTQAQQIDAGRRVVDAGMELSEYVMPGLGGRALWREHAIETARALNAINPHFIRLRSLRVPKRVPLHELVEKGEFELPSDDETAREIKLFLEQLDGITSTVASDHIMNLLEEVEGKLPEDKERMIAVVDRYLDLNEKDRLIYRVGRRGGAFRSLDDLETQPETYRKIEKMIVNLQGKDQSELEAYIKGMVDQYI